MPAQELSTTPLASDGNLKAYYRFSNGALTTDSGPNGYTLTNTGSVSNASGGKFNYGADTVDLSSYRYLRTTAFSFNHLTDWAVSFWVKMNVEISADYQEFFLLGESDGDSIRFHYQYNGGTRRLAVGYHKAGSATNELTYNITLGTSSFRHLAINYTPGTLDLYVDGAFAATVATSGSGSSAREEGFNIGTGTTGDGTRSNAIYDDFAVFTRRLTSTEIGQIYNGFSTNYPLTASQSSYTLTGQTVSITSTRKIAMGQGSFSLTGFDIALSKGIGYILSLATGSFALVGKAIRLLLNGTTATWTKVTKNSSTFTNTSKSSSTFTPVSKNSSTFTNSSKSSAGTFAPTSKNSSTWTNAEKSL